MATHRETIDLDVTCVQPLHDITDHGHMIEISDSMCDSGWVGRPLLMMAEENGDLFALTGTHRLASAERAEIGVPAVIVPIADIGAGILDCNDDWDRISYLTELGMTDLADLVSQEL